METSIWMIISIILFLFVIFLIYRSFKLIKVIEELQQDRRDDVEEISGILELMLTKMKEIDLRGSFEADDEVGLVFNMLKETIEKYRNAIND